MSRVTAFESLRLATVYPPQLVCFLSTLCDERQIALTEAIRECLTAARTLGGAPLMTHERLAYLAHRKKLHLHTVVADVLERGAEQLPEAPQSLRTGIHEFSPEEVEAVIKKLGLSDSQIRSSGLRFAPQIPLQELAHLERVVETEQMGIHEAAKSRLEFWRTLGGASIKAHQRIRRFASTKGISLEGAVANVLTENARQLEDPPPNLVLPHGLQVLPLDGLLERLGERLVEAKAKAVKASAKARKKAGR